MNAMKQKWRSNDTRGVAITWVTIMIVVMMIAVGAILTLTVGYLSRSVSNNAKQQTYFTARAAVDAVALEVASHPDGTMSKILNEMDKLSSFDLGAMDGKTELGNCFLRAVKGADGTVYIEASANKGGQSETVVGQLGLQKIADNYAPTGFAQLILNNMSNKKLKAFQAVSGNLYLGKKAGKNLILSSENGNRIYINGDLHAHTNLSIEGTVEGNLPQIEKRIVAEGNVTVAGNMQIGHKKEGVLDYPNSGIHANGGITLRENVNVFGNLKAQTILISTQSVEHEVIGTVTAKTVVIEGNSYVAGSIVADRVEIRGNAAFKGSITCDSLVIATEGSGMAVYGTNEPIRASAAPSEDAQLKIEQYDTRFVQAPYQAAEMEEPVFPPSDPPVMPDYGELEKSGLLHEIATSGETIGTTDGHDSYYIASKKKLKNITVQGTGKVYLYIKSGVDFDLDEIRFENPDTGMSEFSPCLFVILDNGAAVTASGDFYGYLYGSNGSKIDLKSNTYLYGGLYVEENGSHLAIGEHVAVEYVAPCADAEGTSPAVRYVWYLRQYLPEVPLDAEVIS
jgi:cytoskeletal protein CcmA (bactofilin family)